MLAELQGDQSQRHILTAPRERTYNVRNMAGKTTSGGKLPDSFIDKESGMTCTPQDNGKLPARSSGRILDVIGFVKSSFIGLVTWDTIEHAFNMTPQGLQAVKEELPKALWGDDKYLLLVEKRGILVSGASEKHAVQ